MSQSNQPTNMFKLTSKKEARELHTWATQELARTGVVVGPDGSLGDESLWDQDPEVRSDRAIAFMALQEANEILLPPAKKPKASPSVRPKPRVINWDGGGTISQFERAQNSHTALICKIRRDRDDKAS